MNDNFSACLEHMLKSEGGYVDHPKDPGGATNMGITHITLSDYYGRKVTKREVRNLSKATAAAIYRKNYYDKTNCGKLPNGMDLVVFDANVNSGIGRGPKWFQRGLKVAADGKIGPQTINAALTAPDGVAVIERACMIRLGWLKGLRTWSTFGRGWGRRVASVEASAVAMYTKSMVAVSSQAKRADSAKNKRMRDAGGTGAGAGGAAITDIPLELTYGIIAFAVVVAVVMVTRSRNHKIRADAYREQLEVMQNG